MKWKIIIVILILTLTSCKDENQPSGIVGYWLFYGIEDYDDKINNELISYYHYERIDACYENKTVLCIYQDGKISKNEILLPTRKNNYAKYVGTWQVNNDTLTYITEQNSNQLKFFIEKVNRSRLILKKN